MSPVAPDPDHNDTGYAVASKAAMPKDSAVVGIGKNDAAGARDSQRAAYQTLIDAHEAVLLRAAWRLYGGQADQAQDLVQETLVRGYQAFLAQQFLPGSNARAWLMRILTNIFLNAARQHRWEAGIDLDAMVAAGVQHIEALLAAPADRPDTALLSGTLAEPLERALYALPEELRLCILLVDIEEFSYNETAEIFSIPIGTVRSRLSRARKLLYKLLYSYAREHRLVQTEGA